MGEGFRFLVKKKKKKRRGVLREFSPSYFMSGFCGPPAKPSKKLPSIRKYTFARNPPKTTQKEESCGLQFSFRLV